MTDGREWFRTPEQNEFLKEKITLYALTAQSPPDEAKQVDHVLDVAVAEYWNRWPEQVPRDETVGHATHIQHVQAALAKRKMQIIRHIAYHGNKAVKSGIQHGPTTNSIVDKFFESEPKMRRQQLAHVYGRLYKKEVDELIEPVILEEIGKRPPEKSSGKEKRIYSNKYFALRIALLRDLWEEEENDPEVSKAVVAAREVYYYERRSNNSTQKNKNKNIDPEDGEEDELSNISQQQWYIDRLEGIAEKFLKDLAEKTGWTFSLFMGGLNERGMRETYHAHVGEAYGTQLQWSKYNPDFKNAIMLPFIDFVNQVFPPHLQHEQMEAYRAKQTSKGLGAPPLSESKNMEVIESVEHTEPQKVSNAESDLPLQPHAPVGQFESGGPEMPSAASDPLPSPSPSCSFDLSNFSDPNSDWSFLENDLLAYKDEVDPFIASTKLSLQLHPQSNQSVGNEFFDADFFFPTPPRPNVLNNTIFSAPDFSDGFQYRQESAFSVGADAYRPFQPPSYSHASQNVLNRLLAFGPVDPLPERWWGSSNTSGANFTPQAQAFPPFQPSLLLPLPPLPPHQVTDDMKAPTPPPKPIAPGAVDPEPVVDDDVQDTQGSDNTVTNLTVGKGKKSAKRKSRGPKQPVRNVGSSDIRAGDTTVAEPAAKRPRTVKKKEPPPRRASSRIHGDGYVNTHVQIRENVV